MWTYFHFWRWSITFLDIPRCIYLHPNKACPNNWSNQNPMIEVKTNNNHVVWVYFNYAKWHTLCTLGYVIFCCFMDWPLLPLHFPLTNLVHDFISESNSSTSLPLVAAPPQTLTMGLGKQGCYSNIFFASFVVFPPLTPSH